MRYQGRITTWKDDKGFGFITPNGGGERVFLHINAFSRRPRRPAEQDLVTYALTSDSVLINCAAFGWLLSPSGASVLASLPGAA